MNNKTNLIQSEEIRDSWSSIKISTFLWYNYLIKKIPIKQHNSILYYTLLWMFLSVECYGNEFDLFRRRCLLFLDNRALNE